MTKESPVLSLMAVMVYAGVASAPVEIAPMPYRYRDSDGSISVQGTFVADRRPVPSLSTLRRAPSR